MAEILLNKVINKEIKAELFVTWLLEINSQEQYLGGFKDYKCTRTDFLTYFLNFIHEEVPCVTKHGETPQKPNASRRCDPPQNDKILARGRSSLLSKEDKCDINKSASFTLAPHKSSNESSKFDDNASPQTRSSSTPKLMRTQLDSSLNKSYVSPISPIYRNLTNFWTPKNERNRSIEKGTPLCLGDFIVNRKSSSKKKSNKNISASESSEECSKRIKPTNLSQVKSNGSFIKNDNSFNNFQNAKEVSVDSLNESRNFLAEERLKILSRRDSVGTLTVTSKKISNLLSSKLEVEPDVNLVANKEELSYIVEIYVSILKNGLILNVTSEIYFLISLLLSKQFEGCRDASANSSEDMGIDFLNEEDRCELQGVMGRTKPLYCSELFETVHNIVYFATQCLETQIDVLKYYDKSTLNLLSQNKRLQAFCSVFVEKLRKISQKKSDRVLELSDSNVPTNVCFNLDTDNRENFPSDPAFHTFRKQRDLFYEILRVWEKQHLISNWSFSVNLGGKIKSLFSFQNDPVTFVHFSRLFKAQLLGTCRRFEKEEGLSDMSFLSSIPNVDADKLNRLNSRLVNKQTSNGINSIPTFTGLQEFYKDFIVIAANHTFNIHLCDTFIAEIVDLNDTKFSCTELEEADRSVDPATRKSYLACLKLLRVLAKFLGFVESLPYKSECGNISEKVLNFQITLRKEVGPTFDVKKLLRNSMQQNSIVLTVPWVAKYLSMLDYVTLRLPYYRSVYKILFGLHKNCDKVLGNKANASNYNASLIKFCLGWLFELPHFPDSEYFNFCTEDGDMCASTPYAKSNTTEERKLDDLDIIDQNILYICCPFLEEIKKLVSSNNLNSSVTIKHITPVTAVQSSDEIAKKKIEQQLEEAFFNGQPLSLRKTVEFVSERVASACVKHICNAIVPPFKKSALESLKTFLAAWGERHNVNSPTKEKSLKAALKSKVSQLAHSSLRSLKENCETEIATITKERIPTSVSGLLSVDVLPQTRDVCISVTTRMCLERVQQWISSHVTAAVFTKDFGNETQKFLCPESRKAGKEKPLFLLPPGGSDKSHNESATSAFHLLEKVKGLSTRILENSEGVSGEVVADILDEAYATLVERSDVNESIAMYTCALLVDVSLLLITHKPNLMRNEGLLEKFDRVWKCYNGKVADLFKNLFCPRNVMLLAQAGDNVKVWETFATFAAFLLRNHVLTPDQFESQCTDFYRKEWDQGTLNNFTTFLRKFLGCYRNSGGNPDKFDLLLEFLSDFCSDLC